MNFSSFQKPSRYINSEINALLKDAPVKVCLAFPDVYEIGMSHLGLKILYKIINDLPFASAERVFSPWLDLEAEMKTKGIPLSSLESSRPLRDFDILGFSLQYELSYTTVLNMLHLGGIPLKAEERNNSPSHYPIVIAGGPCTVNPAPMSLFIDAFLVGDGEDAIQEIVDAVYRWKKAGDGKRESVLNALSEIEGMYVPSVHGSAVSSQQSNSPLPPFTKGRYDSIPRGRGGIKRRFIDSLDEAPYPDKPVVPYTLVVHDRVNIEVSRGCSRGCRFCQAGITYRPVRERSPDRVLEIAERSLKNTGYDEVSFTSLSAGDYSCLLQILKEFNRRFSKDKIALSLPSLRVASLNHELLKEIRFVRKTGFTIAPEAGSERLRRVINKDFSEDEYEQTLKALFEEGWHNIKLYFMIGLPTERDEDIEAIPKMVMKALKIAKQRTRRFVNINVGISPFVPKPHTPFQWYGQSPLDELEGKKDYLRDVLTKKGFKVKDHNAEMSLLEASFARGDESLAHIIETAWSLGCRLDGWSEIFDFEKWKRSMDRTGIDVANFARRTFGQSDSLSWDAIDIGVTREFLWEEYQKALSDEITPDCREICQNCGLACQQDTEHGGIAEGVKTITYEPVNSSPGPRFTGSPILDPNVAAQRVKPVKIRVEFSKTGRLRYLSHLELIAVLHRAMRRTGVPLVYSEGFHPSPKISFGPPLGVGIAGLSEYFDMEIVPPFDLTISRRRLNSILPEGIYIKAMAVMPPKSQSLSSFVKRYEYAIKGKDLSHLYRFLSEKERMVKRGNSVINLRDMAEEARLIDEETVHLIVVDQGDIKVRLGELLPNIFNLPIEALDITRLALYGWNGCWVKPLEHISQWTVKS